MIGSSFSPAWLISRYTPSSVSMPASSVWRMLCISRESTSSRFPSHSTLSSRWSPIWSCLRSLAASTFGRNASGFSRFVPGTSMDRRATSSYSKALIMADSTRPHMMLNRFWKYRFIWSGLASPMVMITASSPRSRTPTAYIGNLSFNVRFTHMPLCSSAVMISP